MPLKLSLNRSTIAVGIFVLGIICGQLTPVMWKFALTELMQPAYAEATYRCDRVMREQLFAKQTVNSRPSKETVQALKASELALIDCQDYDLMRKRLIMLGLDENALSYMALQAIESKKHDLQEVVEIHEIRY